jgi:hypothetical protein
VGALPPRQTDLDLDAAVLEVGLQGNEGEPSLGGLPSELQDLALVEKQLPRPIVGVILLIAVAVGADEAADEEELAGAELHVGVTEVESALADGLHLAADETDARLGALEDLVVEERLSVGGQDRLFRQGGASSQPRTPFRGAILR